MEVSRFLVAENRWPLTGDGTGRKGACMVLQSQKPPDLAPSLDRRDVPSGRGLPLVVEVTKLKFFCLLLKKSSVLKEFGQRKLQKYRDFLSNKHFFHLN